jgi:hypothetical protein
MTETRNIPGGRQVISRAGVLVVTDTYQEIRAGGELIGWHLTLREAHLGGKLITGPARARELARAAGIEAPETLTWAGWG